MATSEERLKILTMVQEGKITAEEGIRLMDAMEKGPSPAVKSTSGAAPGMGGKANRWFRVRVTDVHSGKIRVDVRLPVNLVNAGLKMGARFSPEARGLDSEQLAHFINSGETGQIVDIVDDEAGEHVEVFIE